MIKGFPSLVGLQCKLIISDVDNNFSKDNELISGNWDFTEEKEFENTKIYVITV